MTGGPGVMERTDGSGRGTPPLLLIEDTPSLQMIYRSVLTAAGHEVHIASTAADYAALFDAVRVDYSLKRLQHYTGTPVEHFQSYVLFTNYHRYVDAFCDWVARWQARPPAAPGLPAELRVGAPLLH